MSWQVVFPVSNVTLNVNTYTFGNLTFHRANTYNVVQHWNIVNATPVIQSAINRVYNTRVVVEATNIKGSNVENAIKNAVFELEKAYDLFSLTFYQENQKIVISEPHLAEDFYVLVKDLNSNHETLHKKTSEFLDNLAIDTNAIVKIRNLNNLFNFIGKPYGHYYKLEQRICDCLHWCRKGNTESRLENRFLNYWVGLEHILLPQQTRFKAREVKNRTAKLLGLSLDREDEIKDIIDTAWNLRNDIVHEAYHKLTKKEINSIKKIRVYTYAVANNLSSLSKKLPRDHKTITDALLLNKNMKHMERLDMLCDLISNKVNINFLPTLTGVKKYYRGTAILKLNGGNLTNMDVIIRFLDDGEYVYVSGSGKNFSNRTPPPILIGKLTIECSIPSLNNTYILKVNEFNGDIINKIQNNKKLDFNSFYFDM